MSTHEDKAWAALIAKVEAKGKAWAEKQAALYPPKAYTEEQQRAALIGLAEIVSRGKR